MALSSAADGIGQTESRERPTRCSLVIPLTRWKPSGPIAQLWLERTPDKREVRGSTPLRPTRHMKRVSGDIAQLGERLLCTQEVTGSSPVISTKLFSGLVVSDRRTSATAHVTRTSSLTTQ